MPPKKTNELFYLLVDELKIRNNFKKHAYNPDLNIAVQVEGKSSFASTFLLVSVCNLGFLIEHQPR